MIVPRKLHKLCRLLKFFIILQSKKYDINKGILHYDINILFGSTICQLLTKYFEVKIFGEILLTLKISIYDILFFFFFTEEQKILCVYVSSQHSSFFEISLVFLFQLKFFERYIWYQR